MTDVYGNRIQDNNDKLVAGGAGLATAGAGSHTIGRKLNEISKNQLGDANAQAFAAKHNKKKMLKESNRAKALSDSYAKAGEKQRSWFHQLVDRAKSPFSEDAKKRSIKDAKIKELKQNLGTKIDKRSAKVDKLKKAVTDATTSEKRLAKGAAKNVAWGNKLRLTGEAGLLLGAGAAGYGLYNKMKGQ